MVILFFFLCTCIYILFTDQPIEDDAAVPKPSTDHCDYTKKCLTIILEKTREMQKRLKLFECKKQSTAKLNVKKTTEKSLVYSCPLVNQPQLTISPIASSEIRLSNNDGASFSMRSPGSYFLPQFKCPLCLHGYRSQTLLNDHMRKEHSVLI